MEAIKMNNYRMWAYSLISIGLINWNYQRHQSQVVTHSLLIVIPGVILLALTFLPSARNFLQNKVARTSWFLIGIAAIAFAFWN